MRQIVTRARWCLSRQVHKHVQEAAATACALRLRRRRFYCLWQQHARQLAAESSAMQQDALSFAFATSTGRYQAACAAGRAGMQQLCELDGACSA